MKVIITIFLTLNLVACATTAQTVPVQNLGPSSQSLVGERVEVQLRDCNPPKWASLCEEGILLEFTVEADTADGLDGKYGLVPFEQIMSLKLLEYEMHDATRAGLAFGGEFFFKPWPLFSEMRWLQP